MFDYFFGAFLDFQVDTLLFWFWLLWGFIFLRIHKHFLTWFIIAFLALFNVFVSVLFSALFSPFSLLNFAHFLFFLLLLLWYFHHLSEINGSFFVIVSCIFFKWLRLLVLAGKLQVLKGITLWHWKVIKEVFGLLIFTLLSGLVGLRILNDCFHVRKVIKCELRESWW